MEVSVFAIVCINADRNHVYHY